MGPECTGKSDLSQFLAKHYNTQWVPEFARTYLENLQRPYDQQDLLNIALGQLKLEDEISTKANKILVCDTNLYVIKVWSEFKYGFLDEEIKNLMLARKYDLYLLTYIDIPWEFDPQREHPNQRQELYEIYLNEMTSQAVPFIEIKGSRHERRQRAISAIENILFQRSFS